MISTLGAATMRAQIPGPRIDPRSLPEGLRLEFILRLERVMLVMAGWRPGPVENLPVPWRTLVDLHYRAVVLGEGEAALLPIRASRRREIHPLVGATLRELARARPLLTSRAIAEDPRVDGAVGRACRIDGRPVARPTHAMILRFFAREPLGLVDLAEALAARAVALAPHVVGPLGLLRASALARAIGQPVPDTVDAFPAAHLPSAEYDARRALGLPVEGYAVTPDGALAQVWGDIAWRVAGDGTLRIGLGTASIAGLDAADYVLQIEPNGAWHKAPHEPLDEMACERLLTLLRGILPEAYSADMLAD